MATPSSRPLQLTGDIAVDVALTGYYWQLSQDRTLRWSLSNGSAGEYWNSPADMVAGLSQLLGTFSYYANIKFEYVGYFSSPQTAGYVSDLNFAGDAAWKYFSQSSQWARAFFPDSTYDRLAYYGSPGDVYLNLRSPANYLASYAPGSAGYFVFLHETGHALGLKHTHDSGGTGRPTLQSFGLPWLDRDWFSMMSYGDDFDWNQRSWDPATPMLLDVIGLQYLYGPNTKTNADDSTYTLPLSNTYVTIWDAGGVDQIDVSGSTQGWNIYLPDLQLSSLVSTKAGAAVPMAGQIGGQNSFYWLTGDIENVKGSEYADIIVGSALNNFIKGNSGNDLLSGQGGDDSFFLLSGRDALYGGPGMDTFQVGIATADAYGLKLREGCVVVGDKFGSFVLGRDLEKLVFSDKTIEVSSLSPVAGLSPELIELYVSAFRRAPEREGYEFWANMMVTRGLKEVADVIFSLDIVKAVYPTSLSDAQFVTTIYRNVFNKDPDAEGLDYWVQQLRAKSRGELVLKISEVALSTPDGTSGKDFFQNRVDWAIYATAFQVSFKKDVQPSLLTTMTATVTDDVWSVISLIGKGEAGTLF